MCLPQRSRVVLLSGVRSIRAQVMCLCSHTHTEITAGRAQIHSSYAGSVCVCVCVTFLLQGLFGPCAA